MDALLPPGASRSDDIAGPLEPMDWFTGTFKDPEVERRCGAAAFRLAFSVHVTLMSCFVVMGLVAGGIEFSHDGSKLETTLYLASMVVCFFVLSLAIRVRVHYMADEQKAQRFGARAWSVAWLFTTVSDAAIFLEQPRILCETYGPSSDSDPIFDVFFNAVSAFALVVVNSTHGMGFWEKTAVFSVQAADLGLCLLACVREPAAPGARASSAKLLMMTAASVVGFAFSHVLELQLRHHWREYQRMRTIVVVSQGREDEAATARRHGQERAQRRAALPPLVA